MFDHIGLEVGDIGKSVRFYEAALGALGHRKMMQFEHGGITVVGFGSDRPRFWLGQGSPKAAEQELHVSFAAAKRAEVDAFHAAAMKAGGRDNGKPGLRPEYHDNYYGAFVIDPDGNNVEACCHFPS